MKSSFWVPFACFVTLIVLLYGLDWVRTACRTKYAPRIAAAALVVQRIQTAYQESQAASALQEQKESEQLSTLVQSFKEYKGLLDGSTKTLRGAPEACTNP